VNSRDRIISVLNHKEPDRVPFDLGGNWATGISIKAYKNLLQYLSIEKSDLHILDIVQQTAIVHEDILDKLKVDTRGTYPEEPSNWRLFVEEDEHGNKFFKNEYGIGWKMPKGGYYFDPMYSPLANSTIKDLDNYKFPNVKDEKRLGCIKDLLRNYYDKNFFIFMNSISGGFLEVSSWLRGYENFYIDLASDPKFACRLCDRLLEIEMEYWDFVIDKFGEYIQMVYTGNDIGGQGGLLISRSMYQKYIKPRQKRLNSFIKKKNPSMYIFYHSCGSIYEIIPDLIEVGVDAINPVQVSAANMDTAKLKKDFGRYITFWGGGVDTQNILPYGNTSEVKEEVKRRINDLAPGGGFVFATVHNIQGDVPPQNIIAMLEALDEFGKY
jgi:uroporphyrinogen decarboxylase